MAIEKFVDMQPVEVKNAYRYEKLDANGNSTGEYIYLKYAPGALVATPTPLNKATFDPIISEINTLIEAKSVRLFEANPFVYTSGVKSFNVSNYLSNKGYFKVVVLDSKAEPSYSGETTYTHYMTVDLIALENSSCATETLYASTHLEIKNGVLQLIDTATAKKDYIMSIDYFEVK